MLPDGDVIAAHAHITEVGRIDKTFIDCGGTVRKVSTCSLQAWVADDTDHRLEPGQLASILDKAAPILTDEDLDMEIEYEDCQISQFPVENVSVQGDDLKFYLGPSTRIVWRRTFACPTERVRVAANLRLLLGPWCSHDPASSPRMRRLHAQG